MKKVKTFGAITIEYVMTGDQEAVSNTLTILEDDYKILAEFFRSLGITIKIHNVEVEVNETFEDGKVV